MRAAAASVAAQPEAAASVVVVVAAAAASAAAAAAQPVAPAAAAAVAVAAVAAAAAAVPPPPSPVRRRRGPAGARAGRLWGFSPKMETIVPVSYNRSSLEKKPNAGGTPADGDMAPPNEFNQVPSWARSPRSNWAQGGVCWQRLIHHDVLSVLPGQRPVGYVVY